MTVPMNYPGDVTASINERIASKAPAMGPNYLGKPMWPTSAEYDPETDRTRVHFTPVAPAAEIAQDAS